MNKYWFKPKKYGYGFQPSSLEGWLLTLGLVLLIILSAYTNNFFTTDISMTNGFRYIFDVIIIITIFTLVAKDKTDGELKWRWGNKNNKK